MADNEPPLLKRERLYGDERKMTIRTFFVALVGAASTAALLTALTVPVARASGREAANGAERVTGFTPATIAILVDLHTPVLIVLEQTMRRRLARVWVSIGGVIVVFLGFMLFPIIETGSLMPLVWNVQGWIARPVEFAADWLPFFAAAAVYGALAWATTQRGAAGREAVQPGT